MFFGAEREIVAKTKRPKRKQKPKDVMLPNLSGVSFKDALTALLKTPPPKKGKKVVSKPKPVGRPALPEEEKRGRFISTRLSPEEYAEIEKAIASSGETKTEWVRKKLIAAARRA
jgi:hypothetical protein